MNRYQPSTPRSAFGAVAFALTIATLGLLVAGPAALVTQGGDAVFIAQASASPTAAGPIRMLPPVEVVAQRDAKSATIGAKLVQFVRKLQG
jgi:hypothetical protein